MLKCLMLFSWTLACQQRRTVYVVDAAHAMLIDGVLCSQTRKKADATAEAAASKLPAADTRHTYVHDHTTLDMVWLAHVSE